MSASLMIAGFTSLRALNGAVKRRRANKTLTAVIRVRPGWRSLFSFLSVVLCSVLRTFVQQAADQCSSTPGKSVL